jgi:hypothetical protein
MFIRIDRDRRRWQTGGHDPLDGIARHAPARRYGRCKPGTCSRLYYQAPFFDWTARLSVSPCAGRQVADTFSRRIRV